MLSWLVVALVSQLDAANRHFTDGDYEQAAVAAYRADSKLLLAKSLYRLGLFHSALGELSKVVDGVVH